MSSTSGAEAASLQRCAQGSFCSVFCRSLTGLPPQSLARLGANTLAIDASGSNITTAQTHAALDPSLRVINSPFSPSASSSARANTLEYRHTAAERLVEEGKTFDVVCAMEVIEHVEDPRGFLDCLMQLTKVRLWVTPGTSGCSNKPS